MKTIKVSFLDQTGRSRSETVLSYEADRRFMAGGDVKIGQLINGLYGPTDPTGATGPTG
jgi:hypothetical protein